MVSGGKFFPSHPNIRVSYARMLAPSSIPKSKNASARPNEIRESTPKS
jgi:hypothetical protein